VQIIIFLYWFDVPPRSGAEQNIEWSGKPNLQLTTHPTQGHTLKGWEFNPSQKGLIYFSI
jgi:hypothetical protein